MGGIVKLMFVKYFRRLVLIVHVLCSNIARYNNYNIMYQLVIKPSVYLSPHSCHKGRPE